MGIRVNEQLMDSFVSLDTGWIDMGRYEPLTFSLYATGLSTGDTVTIYQSNGSKNPVDGYPYGPSSTEAGQASSTTITPTSLLWAPSIGTQYIRLKKTSASSTQSPPTTPTLTAVAGLSQPNPPTLSVVQGGQSGVGTTTYYAKASYVTNYGETLESAESSLEVLGIPSTPTLTKVAGGTVPRGTTIYTKVTYQDGMGETLPSSEASAVVGVVDPTTAPTLSKAAGALPPATYYAKYTYTDTLGETLASPEVSLVVGVDTPTVALALSSATGTLTPATYFTKYTYVNTFGETLASPESSLAVGVVDPTTAPTLSKAAGSLTPATYYTKYTYVDAFGETLPSSEASLAVGVDTPSAPTVTATTGTGSLAAATYYTVVTYVNTLGETVASPETQTVLSATGEIVVTSPAASGDATGYNVYISTSTGTETKQNSAAVAIGTNYTQSTALIAGAVAPAASTATGELIVESPAASGDATGYNVYISTSTGTETKQNASAITLGTNYVQNAALAAGAAVPASSTATGELVVTSPAASGDATDYNIYISTSTGTETKQNATAIAIGTGYTQSAALAVGAALPSSTTATGELTVASPASSGDATNYNVYISTSTGTETKQASVAIGTNYTQNSALAAGTALPTANTAVGNLLVSAPPAAGDAVWWNLYASTTSGAETKQNGARVSLSKNLTLIATPSTTGATVPTSFTANGLLQVSSPVAITGATSWNAYVSTATGTETKQNTGTLAIGTAWTEPTSGLISGSSRSTTKYTAYVQIAYATGTAGTTAASSEANILLNPEQIFSVASPAASSPATGYNVYAATTSGSEALQNPAPVAIGAAWVEPVTGLTTGGTAAPSTVTAQLSETVVRMWGEVKT